MAITFSCGHCGKTLTTSDDKAGRKAKCPGCGEVLTVPETEGHAEDDPTADDAIDAIEEGDELPAAPPARRRASSEESGGRKTCPMCGEKNAREATACEYCGEKLEDEDEPRSRRTRGRIRHDVEIGEVMTDSWETYKANFGTAFGGHIISAILIGMGCIPLIVLAVIFAIMADQSNGPKEPPVALLLGMIPAFLIALAVAMYLMPGVLRLFIGLARGDDVELLEIFRGGRYSLTYFWVSLVYGCCLLLGTLLLCIPGFMVNIFLWPLVYVVCDDAAKDGNYFSRTLELTKLNWVMSLLLIIIMFAIQLGISLLGAIPCVGPIVSILSIAIQPWFQLMWATAYVKMSGQE